MTYSIIKARPCGGWRALGTNLITWLCHHLSIDVEAGLRQHRADQAVQNIAIRRDRPDDPECHST